MNEEFYFQLYGFLKTLYGGILLGFIYDSINRVIYFATNKIALSDIIFWIIGVVLILNIFFSASYLNLRLYLVLGFIIGWLLYYFFVSPLYRKLLSIFFSGFNFCFGKTKNFISENNKKMKIKYKKPIAKINVGLKRIRKLPFKCKMQYNKLRKVKKDEAVTYVKKTRENKVRRKQKKES